MPEHTEECLRQQGQARQAQEEYKTAWPYYCRMCNAEGGYHGTEMVTNDPYPMYTTYFDPCPVCMEHGRCPRCGESTFGEEIDESGEYKCVKCGWNEAKPDALPIPQCICDAEFP